MFRTGFVFATALAVLFWVVRCEDELKKRPLVATKYGPVMGRHMVSRGGRTYAAFTSIPYAKPPTGDRRFKPPEPMDPWEGTIDASKELVLCLQVPIYDPFLRNTSRGTDDCLYLNVFSPNLTGSMAVMFYIHGGGFRSSAPGIGPSTRSKYLMDEDVVLVAANYRLGVLGFLSTEDKVISGNFGLKDQLAALKWVKENIKAFGGDPSKVTVFGESAGGASTHFLLLSSASRDYVTRGILQSGVAFCLWSLSAPGIARYRAHRLAESFSCPKAPHEDLLACLLTKTSKELIESDWKFNIDDFNPSVLYPPVIESKEVHEPFLTDSPFNLKNNDKTWIAGITTGEGSFKLLSFKTEPELMDRFKSNMDLLLPEGIMYTNTTTQLEHVTESIKNKYFSNGNIFEGTKDVFSEAFFLWPLVKALQVSNVTKYVYLFDHRGKTSATDIAAKEGGIEVGDLGVSHTDDLLYLFNFEDEVPDMMTPKDTEVSKRMVKLWTTFAIHGVPTLKGDKVKWNKFGKDKSYLRITTNESKMETGYGKEAIKFWYSLPLRDKMEKMNL